MSIDLVTEEQATERRTWEERAQRYLDWQTGPLPDPLALCIHYYALDAAQTLDWPHRLAADRLRERLREQQYDYDRALGLLLRDYLSLASWGEILRHPGAAGVRICDPHIGHWWANSMRTRYELALHFDRDSLLDQLKRLHVYRWNESNACGPLWARIAALAREWPGTDDPAALHVWIDRVWDLRHNSGPAFDKPALILTSTNRHLLTYWLTAKRYLPAADTLLHHQLGGGRSGLWRTLWRPDWEWEPGPGRLEMVAYIPAATRRLLDQLATLHGWDLAPWPSAEDMYARYGSLVEQRADSVQRVMQYAPMEWGEVPEMLWEPIREGDPEYEAEEEEEEEDDADDE